MHSLEEESGDVPGGKVKSLHLARRRRPSRDRLGIKRINILGFHSMNENYEFSDDLSQLHYLALPNEPSVHYDLKMNADKIIRRKCATNDVKLDSLFRWIISHRDECTDVEKRFACDFATFRGVLTALMCTPFEKHEGWIICASKLGGTIFLCKYDTPEKVRAEESRSNREKEMSDWGHKFEQFLLSEHPGGLPNIDEANNHNEEFNCVFRSVIGPYNLLYSAEMDGLQIRKKETNLKEIKNDPKRLKEILENGDAEFVELKTSADPSARSWEWQKIRRFKSYKWWAQSYLVGIENLICGYRDNDGVVKRLQKFAVGKLPQLGEGFWDPQICLQYLVDFLKLVMDQVSSGCEEQLWKFTWYPEPQPDVIQVELCDHSSPYLFLHKWVTDELASGKRKREETPKSASACSSKKK